MHTVSRPFFWSKDVIANVFVAITPKQNLVAEIDNLKQQLATEDAVRVERDFYKQENQELQNILGRMGTSTENKVLARIISKPAFSPYDTLIIDQGEKDGIKVGDLVLLDDTVVLGEIGVVFAHNANVILYSSSDQKVEVLIGEQAIESVATGKGGGNFELKLPRNTNVKEGDVVTLAKTPTKLFGQISVIKTNPEDTFEHVLFTSLVNIAEIKFVIVEQQK